MVYNYTKPRGAIAAMYSSPGPCYQLPGLTGAPAHDPRSVHNKAAAYSFGLKHGKWQNDAGPGPAYLPQAKTYRDGKDGTPHYTLSSRHATGTAQKTPGPGAYQPESCGQMAKRRAPAYSMKSRTGLKNSDASPGPAAYQMPGMTGKTIMSNKKQAPSVSMAGRSQIGSFHEDLKKTPGPGNYIVTDPNLYKGKAPGYSMIGRNQMPGDGTQKPGPGAHSPEKVYNATKRSAPAPYFGIKHSQYEGVMIAEPANEC